MSKLDLDYGYIIFNKGQKFYHSSQFELKQNSNEYNKIYLTLFYFFENKNCLYELTLKKRY